MKWVHKCKIEWLAARQMFITATDIKDLLPVTKTGRKRTIGDEDYLKVLARKLAKISPEDCVSTGSAARGHILEPYAVDAFNREFGKDMHHWDDAIVAKPMPGAYNLAFSPDAMSIEQPADTVVENIGPDPIEIAEVKCYYPERHFVCGNTAKDKLDERWQVAAAMAVRSEISKAYVIFYNPSMEAQLYVFEYSRKDLEDEIKTIAEAEALWHLWYDNYSFAADAVLVHGSADREDEIVEEVIKQEELNPTGCRSIQDW